MMNPSLRTPRDLIRLGILACVAFGAVAGAETIVLHPTLTYTVAELNSGVFRYLKPGELYSNGYTPGTYSSKATVARMEFRIPPE